MLWLLLHFGLKVVTFGQNWPQMLTNIRTASQTSYGALIKSGKRCVNPVGGLCRDNNITNITNIANMALGYNITNIANMAPGYNIANVANMALS